MPKMEESKLYKFLEKLVHNWHSIPIRVLQDGKWQSLFLSEIEDDKPIVEWLIKQLQNYEQWK
jgi:hypothetical protein